MAESKKILVQKLATKHNLPLKTVESIIDSQFKYVARTMEVGNFHAVRLPYFGKFSAKKGRIKHVTDLKKRK